jgi:hypothetical protein
MIKIMLNSGSLQEGIQKRCAAECVYLQTIPIYTQNFFHHPQAECPTHIHCAPKYPSCRKAQVLYPRLGVRTGCLTSAAKQALQQLRSRPRVSPPTAGRRQSLKQPALACCSERTGLASPPLSGGVFPFKMIRRHREQGCSLSDGD